MQFEIPEIRPKISLDNPSKFTICHMTIMSANAVSFAETPHLALFVTQIKPMKKILVSFHSNPFRHSVLGRLSPVIGGLLLTTLTLNAQVALTFDDGLQGVVAGGDATSLVWDSVGKRLEINTVGGWKQSCAFLDLNSADPAIVPLRAELGLALTNGGTLSYEIIVETTSVTSIDPLNPVNPGWFETMYIGNSSAGWDQTYGPGKGQIVNPAFPLTQPILNTVSYTIEAASSVASDMIAQFGAASGWYQINFGLNSQSGTNVKYYIDNIKIDANEVVAPVVIPNVTITPAVPGLNIITSTTGTYDRQTVRTGAEAAQTWVGGTFPKSYEITVADYPLVAGFETFINFVPGTGTPNSYAHYSEPTVAGVWIYSDGLGGGTAYFRYKVNSPGSNGPAGNEFWVQETAPSPGLGGQITSRYSTKMLGTWKITFTSDTDFTITVPDGTTTTGALNPTVAAKFGNPDPINNPNPMIVYFGNTPASDANRGLAAVVSRIKITGTGDPIDEEFSVNPYSGDLEVTASVPTAVVQVLPENAKFWLNWTMPATDFQPMQSMDLGVTDPWVALPAGTAHATKFGRSRLLLETELASPTRSFIRLVRPGTP
jgi:hypothetical protein